jgi:hypothetical protein
MNKKYQLLNDFMTASDFKNRIMINNMTYKLGKYEKSKNPSYPYLLISCNHRLTETPPSAARSRGLGSQPQRRNVVADQSDKT